MKGSLYIHIPFCRQRCDYCDFYSTTHCDLHTQQQTINLIERQIQNIAERWHPQIQSVYFGGGTPSSLPFSLLESLFNALHKNLTLTAECEVTMEVNPETVSADFLGFLKGSPVNRLSMGVQSFQESSLILLGRRLSPQTTRQALDRLAQAPLKSWSTELIGEIPGEQDGTLLNDFNELLQWRPPHFSCYALSLPEQSRLEERLSHKEIRSSIEALFEKAQEVGYQRYEISSGALENHRCLHNCAYWKMENFWGCGPSGSGTFAVAPQRYQRWEGKSPLEAFLASVNEVEESWHREEIDPKDFAFECVMMGLRLKEGINLNAFQERTGYEFLSMAPKTIQKALNERSFALSNTFFFPLERGFLLLNRFLVDFLVEFDKNSLIG